MDREQGFILKKITYIIQTTIGDKWMNKQDFNFYESINKETGEKIVVVEEKD